MRALLVKVGRAAADGSCMARPLLRPLLPWILLALLGAAALAWLGLIGFVWNDYEVEAAPAFDALTHGYFALFLQLCPAYGGSLIMRAPFALAAHGLGGGEVAVFRAVAVPCLLAGAALGVVLASSAARARRRPRHRGDRGGAVRVQPDHAARARHRPPGGAARRRAVGGRRARRAARAPDVGRRAARARGRQQGVGAAGGRAGAAGAAGAARVGAHDRVGDRARVHGPGAARVAPGRPAERARRADRRDLPAVAGVVVLRLGRPR